MPSKPSTEIVAYDPELFPALLDQDPREATARFARRFMIAESLDDLFNVLEGNTSQAMVGRTIEIKAVAWVPYEADIGVIPNAICQAVDTATGEILEFATTSSALTMFIRRAELIGEIPFEAKIAAKKTRSGQTALNFERI